jgi:hypothetical protein
MAKGFGPAQEPPKVSKRAEDRKVAGKKLENMKASGAPEFEIFMRIQGKPNWVPVGAIAVQRTAMVNRAIFDNEDQLLQAAFRIAPTLKRFKDQLEYGYRVKEFKDEPIEVAVRPPEIKPGVLAQIGQKLGGLLKRS